MQQWKLTLAYDGTAFHGWQVQPGLATVQGVLAAALRHVTGESVLPQGSGRTDTGVHALAQVASVSLAAPIPPANLLRALNRALPASVRVLSAVHAPADFHARHSAIAKTYEYRIFPLSRTAAERDRTPSSRICPPFLAPYVWDCPWAITFELAQSAAAGVVGTHDFTSFAATDPDLARREEQRSHDHLEGVSNIRTIHQSEFSERDGLLIYRVTGTGFLHHMVRNLVGTFVEIGSRRTPLDAIPRILDARRRWAAGPTAPARGLFLLSVDYPEADGITAEALNSENAIDPYRRDRVSP